KAPTTPRRVFGVLLGTMVAITAVALGGLASPLMTSLIFALPLGGWLLGGAFESQESTKTLVDERGSFIGMGMGVLLASGLVAFGVVSPALALLLPAIGAGIGHLAQNRKAADSLAFA